MAAACVKIPKRSGAAESVVLRSVLRNGTDTSMMWAVGPSEHVSEA